MQRVERVEQALVQSGLVRTCIALRTGAELVAFVAPAGGSPQALHAHLQTSVPADLLPQVYVGLTQLPEFAGRQVDLARLLALSALDSQVAWIHSVAPRAPRSVPVAIHADAAAVRPAGRRLWSPALRDAVFESDLDPERMTATGCGWLLGAAIDGACRALGTSHCVLEDVTFDTPLALEPHERRTLQVILSLDGRGEVFKVVSRPNDSLGAEPQWTEHVTGSIAGGTADAALPPAMMATDRQAWIDRSQALVGSALDAAWRADDEVLYRLLVSEELAGCEVPTLVEACVQAAQALATTHDGQRLFLQGCERLLVVAAPRPGEHWCRVKLRSLDGTLYGSAEVYDAEGQPLLVGEGLYLGVAPHGLWERQATMDRNGQQHTGDFEPVAAGSTFLAEWNQSPATQRRALMEKLVERLTRELTGLDAEAPFDTGQGFFDAGMNSLAAVMLCVRLQQELGQPLSETLAFSYSTPQQLAAHLCDDVLGLHASSGSTAEAGTAPPGPATDLDGLSADQLATRLVEQLEQLRTGARA